MYHRPRWQRLLAGCFAPLSVLLASCGGGGDSGGDSGDGGATLHTVGGSISGLTASGLVLANGSDTRSVGAGATSFTLPTGLATGSSFNVTVQAQPAGLTCTVANGSGIIGTTNVANVAVTCNANTFTLGGSISGLSGIGLVLANGSDTLSVAPKATSFSMPTVVAFGSTFDVTVRTQADEDTCSISNGSGTMGTADVTSVSITCQPATFTVNTFAGSATVAGSADGVGAAAFFSSPFFFAFDRAGDLYVTEIGNHDIRKITPAGVVSTFAGSGVVSGADGTGTSASFNFPVGIAVDGSGNVFVADRGNRKVRKITAAGAVSALAGSGATGSADGIGTAASFNSPGGMSIDSSGNLYVADVDNNKIRRITPAGVVSTLAGSGVAGSADGTGTAASFSSPIGVAVDGSGNVYVTDTGNHKVRRITPTGVVSTFAGSGTAGNADGTGTSASFNSPVGIVVDGSGSVLVADFGNHKVRRITPAGVVSTLAGYGAVGSADGSSTVASFNSPVGIIVDGSGNVLVADFGNHTIRKVTRD